MQRPREWTPDHVVELDVTKPLPADSAAGHNRWHTKVPPAVRVRPGETVALDVIDSSDAQVTGHSERDTAAGSDLDRLHPLTGPIHVAGAEPGDLLEVEILDIALADWGWSGVYPNGGGLMSDAITTPEVFTWRFADGEATSPDIPGVRVVGRPFIGVIGIAPSDARREAVVARERRLVDRGGVAFLPLERGGIPQGTVAEEGLRSMPARELGSNLDIKDIAAGSRFVVRVDVVGGLVSVGDLHFAQGDGESLGTAIEASGHVLLRCHVHKAAGVAWIPDYPVILVDDGRSRLGPGPWILTSGIAIGDRGELEYVDVSLATRRALESLIGYLTEARGFSWNQACTIATVAADLHSSVIANPPSPVVVAALPLSVLTNDRRWLADGYA